MYGDLTKCFRNVCGIYLVGGANAPLRLFSASVQAQLLTQTKIKNCNGKNTFNVVFLYKKI